MQFITLTVTSLLSALALAAPAPQTTVTPGQTSPWSVTSYTEGCSPGGCTYSFDLSGPDTPGFGGAFSTHCEGTDVQNKLVNCTNTQFSANLVPTEDQDSILYVQRLFPFGTETDVAGGNVTIGLASPGVEYDYTINAQVYGALAR